MQNTKQNLKTRIEKVSKNLQKYYTADELKIMIKNTTIMIDKIDTKKDLNVLVRYHDDELENLLECMAEVY